ncbi:hypothetical protein [Bacillus amyloliquefaciens]|uniref:hypothetical protein n=1 Tax=Bacillus amyloliquefaciens TaxID=1390 RepID=UPI000779C55E|nr:hypothetical protein [Bacillus amyloliquefaciens]
MKSVHFKRRTLDSQVTIGPEGEEMYYMVSEVTGIGENTSYQVDYESSRSRGSLMFESTNHVEKDGIRFYLN